MIRWLERAAIVVAGLALAIAVIALLSGGLAGGRDDPGVATAGARPPGTAYRDLGDADLASGARHPTYDSNPPTSGPHHPASVRRDGAPISADQLLESLARGDVVLLYSTARPPAGLRAVARAAAPPFTPALAGSGQAVILARWPGLRTITAVAWAHMLRSNEASALREFADYWLGRGAPSHASRIVGTG